jgi:hypothetical protein
MMSNTAIFSLREMTKNDLLETFLMRNDTEVCKYAMTPDPISWAEHEGTFLYTDYPKFIFTVKNYDLIPFEETVGYVEFRHDTINDDPAVKIWGFHIDRGKEVWYMQNMGNC